MARCDREKAELLSRDAYDDDAPDVPSDADEETIDARTSGEILRETQEVFGDDYEEDHPGPGAQEEKSQGGFGRLFNSRRDTPVNEERNPRPEMLWRGVDPARCG